MTFSLKLPLLQIPPAFLVAGSQPKSYLALASFNGDRDIIFFFSAKPALHSFHENGTWENFVIPCSTVNSSIFVECNAAQVKNCPDYNTTKDSLTFKEAAVFDEGDTHTNHGRSGTEEVVGSNPTCPLDDTLDYSSMKSGPDPTLEIPVHEELTNAAESPTFGGQVDASEKEKDATMLSPKNHEKSSAAGSLHEDAAHNDEIFGSEDGGGSNDDQASERVPLASTLFNYQSFMDKTPSGKWSKQDTELFYEEEDMAKSEQEAPVQDQEDNGPFHVP
ncbi:Transcription factor TFIIIB component B'' [Senna tora]|uniref:Transcription factor TFIIIB component B n=1 Tax=Senna tora TaxID=362788 RepID=A0A834STE0_9FABA|nr:Transcription factor TFIIIB component B'' [Senna tora]